VLRIVASSNFADPVKYALSPALDAGLADKIPCPEKLPSATTTFSSLKAPKAIWPLCPLISVF